jgi:CRISPR-associated endonuclease Cas3-HD
MLRKGVRVEDMMSNCIEVIKREWPLAYAKCSKGSIDTRVKLLDHNVLTGMLIQQVLKDRIKVLERSVLNVLPLQEFSQLDMIEIGYIVGLIHDLGKASPYYLERNFSRYNEDKFELSFLGHEHVIALILSQLAINEVDIKFKLIYDLLAKIISRHHSAMPTRHPLTLWSSPTSGVAVERRYVGKGLEIIRGEIGKAVLDMYNASVVNYIINDLSKLCGTEVCKKIVNDLTEELMNQHIRNNFERIIGDLARRLTSFKVLGLGKVDKISEEKIELMIYKLVSTLSGFLIVADNLAAQLEGRSSDDKSSKLYVEYWMRELKDKLSSISKQSLMKK